MNKMATILAGGLLLIGGSLLYLGVHIAAVLYMPQVNAWKQYGGRYMTAVADSGGYWMFWLSIVLIALGLLLLSTKLFEALGRKWQSDVHEMRLRDEAFDEQRARSEDQKAE